MESLIKGVKSALLDPDLAQVWFRQVLHNNVFEDEKFRVTLYEVQKYTDKTTHLTTDFLDIKTLLQRVGAVHPEQIATFQLIKIRFIKPDYLLNLLRLFEIDDAALLVLNSGPFHFQSFVESSAYPDTVSFALAYNVATMLWSSNPKTQAIRAIAIGEGERPFSKGDIERFKSDLTHPLTPGLLALHVQLEAFHGVNRKLVNRLRDVETETGHRDRNQSAGRMDFVRLEHLDLDSISQNVSNIHYEAFSLQRTFLAIKDIVQELRGLCSFNKIIKEASKGPSQAAFQTSIRWRLKSLDSLIEQTQYLLNRVGVQETVVVNLRTKKDTQHTIALTETSTRSALASAALARAAKKDSSSMQTIAVVTMALLPATYFAALFAMPLLRWDQKPVIQNEFWIYLAFTLPSTALVFILWFIITKTSVINNLILICQGKRNPKPV